MDFNEMKQYIGSLTALTNSSGVFIGGIVTEIDLERFINIRYKQLFNTFSEMYEDRFSMAANIDLLDGQEVYPLIDDLSDTHVIKVVYVKSHENADSIRAYRKKEGTLKNNIDGMTRGSYGKPFYYTTSVKLLPKKLVPAIGILPIPDRDVQDGITVKYVELPVKLENSDDIPYQIPDGAHELICLAVISDVWQAKKDWQTAERTFNRFLHERNEFMSSYQPEASDKPPATVPSKGFKLRRRFNT
jgi:hypothetical protein